MDVGIFGFEPTVDKVVEEVAVAAGQGFSSFLVPQIFGFDALTALAIAGREVPEIKLGTSVIPTYPRHPMMLASCGQCLVGRRHPLLVEHGPE